MASKAKKKIKRDFKPLIPAFEKPEPLKKDDITCKICFSIFLNPVTFPCNHSLCQPCFDTHIKDTSLKCPFCNCRVSVWSRHALKANNVVNLKFKARIEEEFPNEVAVVKRELEGFENENEENIYNIRVADINSLMEDEDEDGAVHVRDGEFSKPGEIAKDLEIIYFQQRQELEKERKEELDASQILIEQIIKEEEPISTQIESDFQLAQRLAMAGDSPKKLRHQLDSPIPVQAPKLNLAQRLISKSQKCGSKKRQRKSGPSLLSSKKKRDGSSFKSPSSNKKEDGKQTKIQSFFSYPSESESSFHDSTISSMDEWASEDMIFPEVPSSPKPCCSSSIRRRDSLEETEDFNDFKELEFTEEKPRTILDFEPSPPSISLMGSPQTHSDWTGSPPDLKPELDLGLDENANYVEMKGKDGEESLEDEVKLDPELMMLLEEERMLEEEKRRREEEDLKFAMELQKMYEESSSGKVRGRKGSNSEKYSLRNWMRTSQV